MKLIPILLPTTEEQSGNGLLLTNGRLHKPVAGGEYRRCVHNGSIPQHLYLCSNREINAKDYFIDPKDLTRVCLSYGKESSSTMIKRGLRVEFTNDPETIADGVLPLPEKAINNDMFERGFFERVSVNFLNEFVKRYSQIVKINSDVNDAEVFAGKFTIVWDNTVSFTEEAMIKAYEAGQDYNADLLTSTYQNRPKDGKEYILSITKPKDMVIECELECYQVSTYAGGNEIEGSQKYRIKSINGIPIVVFK